MSFLGLSILTATVCLRVPKTVKDAKQNLGPAYDSRASREKVLM